ncbi:MAG: DUF4129 domain-containing protein [Pirellulales bacterium]
MAKRLHQTMADYVVIAISPALIMLLVGSLVFFLIAVFYQGEYPARLNWVMACFVFAAVLVGRISIEEGLERAMPFGIALALVVGIAVNRFVELHGGWIERVGPILNWGLIGLAWWCAHKLTWDCTVIDDTQDASGEGLLQAVGLEGAAAKGTAAEQLAAHALEGTTTREARAGWWQRYVENQRRPHAPGVWVVYFSLAALPLFGIGQWFIPVSETGTRRYTFWLLSVYVAAGMGLLLTTSFLGLRRYLRQRRVEMPTAMANFWLGIGAVLIVMLLVVSALLPRPSAEYAISQLPFSVGSPDRNASRMAPVPREGVQDEQPGPAPAQEPEQDAPPGSSTGQNAAGEPSPDSSDNSQGPAGEKSQSPGKAAGQGSNEADGGQDSKSADERNGTEESDSQQNDSQQTDAQQKAPQQKDPQQQSAQQQSAEQQNAAPKPAEQQGEPSPSAAQPAEQPAPPPNLPNIVPPPVSFLAQLLQWAFYAVVALAIAYALWRYRAEVLAALRNFLQGLRDFWNGLWGGRRAAGVAGDEPVEIKVPPAPFSTYADPFASGVAGRYPLSELVRYSFEAFEAWAREHGCEREPDQTPHELARDVSKLNTFMAADARNLTELYVRVAYARGNLPDTTREQLEHAWQTMRQSAARPR